MNQKAYQLSELIALLNKRYDENARLALAFALDHIADAYPRELVTVDTWPLGWAQTACPNLYNRIAIWIPDQISRAMEERRPFAELQTLLQQWTGLHDQLYAMFVGSRGQPVRCGACGEMQTNAVALARHLNACPKKPSKRLDEPATPAKGEAQ